MFVKVKKGETIFKKVQYQDKTIPEIQISSLLSGEGQLHQCKSAGQHFSQLHPGKYMFETYTRFSYIQT